MGSKRAGRTAASPGKKAAKPPIFISYGHGDGTELAERLAADLGRDYCVLLDKQFMSAGDWQYQIERVLPRAKLVVYVLTPHSTREKSVCRDEIAVAEHNNLKIIPVLGLMCDSPLPVARYHRTDFQALRYAAALAKLRALIKKVLAGGSVPLAQGPIPTWSLAPMFDRVIQDHQSFMGRDWLFGEIEKYNREGDATRMTLITGKMGAGKSAIIAQFSEKSRYGRVLVHHFCRYNISPTLNPIGFVRNLAYCLGQQLPQYGEALERSHTRKQLNLLADADSTKEAGAFFESIILEPLKSIGLPAEIGDGPCWILVDALDEGAEFVEGVANKKKAAITIIDVIKAHLRSLPSWMRFVATCRSGEIPNRLRDLTGSDGRPMVWSIHLSGERHNEDLREYIKWRHGEARKAPPPDEEIDALIRKLTDSTFLLVKHMLDGVFIGMYPNMESAPRSLYPIYEDNFMRLYPNPQDKVFAKEVCPLLSTIVTAREPLSVESFARAVPGVSVQGHLQRLAAFLPEQANSVYFHKSLADWLRTPTAVRTYAINQAQGHARLAAFCWDAYQNRASKKLDIELLRGDEPSEYMLRNGVLHCLAAGELEHAIELLYFIAKGWDEITAKALGFAPVSPERLTQVLLLALAEFRPDGKRRARMKKEIDPDQLAYLIEDFYKVEPLKAPLKFLSGSRRWPDIRERFLAEGNYVLRFAISEVRADACAEGDEDIGDVYKDLCGDNLNRSELAAYTLRHFYAQEPGEIESEYLKRMGESETYPGRSALGDLLLSLTFQKGRPFDFGALQSERFWKPVWEHNAHDVWDLRAARTFIDAGYPTTGAAPDGADAGTRVAYRNFQITEILRQEMLAAQDVRADRTILPLIEQYYQLGTAPKRISRARKALAEHPRLEQLMRLFFAHPQWDVAETAASVLTSIVEKDESENSEGGGSKKKIVTALFSDEYWQERFDMDCYWRVCFGAIEAAYQLVPVDDMGLFGTAVDRFYDYPNSRVRALCAENLIAHIVTRPLSVRRVLLGRFSDAVKRWIADDDAWVLEHVFRLMKALKPTEIEEFRLLDVGKPTLLDGFDWLNLTRAKFLTDIEKRQRERVISPPA
jgi:TIR domain